MGIVLKQTFRGSIYAYLGVILGGINVAILFPILFSEEQIGLINILITVSAICAQFSSLGVAGIINYFFPKFRNNDNAHHSFFIFITLFASVGFIVFSFIFYFFGDEFLYTKASTSGLQEEFSYLIFPLTFFTLGFIIVDFFSSSTYNSTIGSLYKDVILRIFISLLIILFYFKVIDFSTFLFLYTLNLGTPVLGVLIYLSRKNQIDFKIPKKEIYFPHIRKMLSVGIFYILTGLSNILATYIDKYMINYFIGLKPTGIYSVTNYFGTLVRIPRNSMGKIATPILARLYEENNTVELSVLLKKSSVSQVLIGMFIFIGIWVNIDLILSILPQSYMEGKWVVFYISISHIFHCFIGVGGLMIQISKEYRYSTFLTICLGVFVVVFNLMLIPEYGIVGAAISTALAKGLFVLLSLIFIRVKMNLNFIGLGHLKIILSGTIAVLLVYLIPDINLSGNKYLFLAINIVYKSIMVTVFYVSLLFATRFIKKVNNVKNYF